MSAVHPGAGVVDAASLEPRRAVATPRESPGGVRVLRIIDRLNVGGPARHVVTLTAGLDPGAFETLLVTGRILAAEGDMMYLARRAGIDPLVMPEMSRELTARDALVVLKLFRIMRRFRPHIVHTHKAKAGATGRLAAWLYRWTTWSAFRLGPRPCRVVHTYHGHVFHSYYGPLKTRLFLAVERLLARLCTDRLVVVSERQRQEICSKYRVGRPDQFEVVALGIDPCEAGASGRLRAGIGATDQDLLVGMVGRLTEVKNPFMLVDVAAELTDSVPAARFVLIGDGHLRPALEARIHRLGLAGRVTLTGFRADVRDLYGDLAVVALTSLNEGTPLTLIEAMSAGRPVVATEVGGVADIMGAFVEARAGFSVWAHGLTAPPRDVRAFARALRFLLEHPPLGRAMGERGRAHVRRHLSRERLVSDVERLYRAITRPAAR
jgi:glycosyltransferase involved in cell wall biosynthesis